MVFLLPFSVLIYSCYPEFDATVEELDLAITKYDEDQNFGALNSFFLYDTIIYINDKENPAPHTDHPQEDHILDQVRQNLINIGWTEVTDTVGGVDADVSIMISALEVDVNFYYYGWWDYWYWYPWDWWYPWYPGYPGYPWYPTYPIYPSYGYTVGTVMIDMVNMGDIVMPQIEPDPDPENPIFRVPIVWTGAVNGILSGSQENIESRLTTQIEQVFRQSDYLYKKTPK